MASLNIRNFPEELLFALNIMAAQRRGTLRGLVIKELGEVAEASGFPSRDRIVQAIEFFSLDDTVKAREAKKKNGGEKRR